MMYYRIYDRSYAPAFVLTKKFHREIETRGSTEGFLSIALRLVDISLIWWSTTRHLMEGAKENWSFS